MRGMYYLAFLAILALITWAALALAILRGP
jgi:hypothetical protein